MPKLIRKPLILFLVIGLLVTSFAFVSFNESYFSQNKINSNGNLKLSAQNTNNNYVSFSLNQNKTGSEKIKSQQLGVNKNLSSTNKSVPTDFNGTGLKCAGTRYRIQFREAGLPANTMWSMVISIFQSGYYYQKSNSSLNNTINFSMINGTYSYFPEECLSSGNFLYCSHSGNFTVNGSSKEITVNYTKKAEIFTVKFEEQGLPAGTYWHLTLISAVGISCIYNIEQSNNIICFTVENGTHAYIPETRILAGNYFYFAKEGNVSINGANETVYVNYTAEKEYVLAFKESGLSAGCSFQVTLNGDKIYGYLNGSCYVFPVTNGTYSYTVMQNYCYEISNLSGNLTISGANLTYNLTFTRLYYGLTSGVVFEILEIAAGMVTVLAISIILIITRRQI